MSALTFTLRRDPGLRVDVSPLHASRLAGLSLDEIKAIGLHAGCERVAAGDVFAVRGRNAEDIRFAGETHRLDCVGHEMHGGAITVEGDAGVQAGRRMKGGTLTVAGNAGPWAGSQMAGGRLEIGGNAGDRLGAPLAGELQGMTGGVIMVGGNAGDRAGERLRRGAIVVRRNAGDYAGYRMIAGTLIVLGKAGALPGFGMGRGTIVLGRGAFRLSPTFADCGPQELAFLGLLARTLAAQDVDTGALLRKPLRRYAGDLAASGKGELFTPV